MLEAYLASAAVGLVFGAVAGFIGFLWSMPKPGEWNWGGLILFIFGVLGFAAGSNLYLLGVAIKTAMAPDSGSWHSLGAAVAVLFAWAVQFGGVLFL